jgi:MarR family transcriptional regulator, organic hydroperoxide resistance regulator
VNSASYEQLLLAKFLPYLLNRAGVQTGQIFSLALKEFGLTLADWRILIALWQREDQRLRDLVETTVVDHSTLSRQIVALEDAGLLVRRRSKNDGRALCIGLTAKGKKLTARIIPVARQQAAAAIDGLTKPQLQTLEECLNRIFENLQVLEKQVLANLDTELD